MSTFSWKKLKWVIGDSSLKRAICIRIKGGSPKIIGKKRFYITTLSKLGALRINSNTISICYTVYLQFVCHPRCCSHMGRNTHHH